MIRIEYKNGLGVFHAREERIPILEKHSNFREIWDRHCNEEKFPSYRRDTQLVKQINLLKEDILSYKFAFKTLEQFQTAFLQKEVEEFIEMGFKIFYIEAEDFLESDYQIIFKPKTITKKEDISSLWIKKDL